MTQKPFDPNAAASPNSGVFGLPFTLEEAKVVLLPVPFEATTSYKGGTQNGPQAIFSASKQVDLFDIETGHPYKAGIAMLEEPAQVRTWSQTARQLAQPIIDKGGADASDSAVLQQIDGLCEQMNDWVYEETRKWLAHNKRVGIIGGDHSTVFGSILAHAEKFPNLGILHIDAHADLRDAYEGFTWSHASIMFNVLQRIPQVSRIVQVAIRDLGESEFDVIEQSKGRIKTYFDAHLAQRQFEGTSFGNVVHEIVSNLPQHVYVSFDIDGLDPVLCPNTGTPVPGGLSFAQANALVQGIVKSGRHLVGFDLNEVAPGPGDDEWDGNVGARLLYKLVGWMLKSEQR